VGQGVDKDYGQAALHLRSAAERGDPEAQYNLASLYEKGLGVACDLGEALHWYELSAAGGIVEAQASLGLLYATGQQPNYVRAYLWFQLAAEKGNAAAKANCGLAETLMTPAQIAEAKALAAAWAMQHPE
jgi:TPR repeat protein